MAIDLADRIDAIGMEKATDFVVLSILDSWTWDDEQSHLTALQDKLNAYFEFIESGQIYLSYPNSVGKKLVIDIIGRHPKPASMNSFLEQATSTAKELEVVVRCKHIP